MACCWRFWPNDKVYASSNCGGCRRAVFGKRFFRGRTLASVFQLKPRSARAGPALSSACSIGCRVFLFPITMHISTSILLEWYVSMQISTSRSFLWQRKRWSGHPERPERNDGETFFERTGTLINTTTIKNLCILSKSARSNILTFAVRSVILFSTICWI
jgi:hypothetical protein